MSTSLEGRVAVVFGVANKRSIAWSIAQGLHQAGAQVAITYQNERLELEAKDLISSLPGAEGFMCDVSDDAAIDRLFGLLKQRYGKLHVLVHSVAFAPADFVDLFHDHYRVRDLSSLHRLDRERRRRRRPSTCCASEGSVVHCAGDDQRRGRYAGQC